jgi:hypothetical protein
MTFILILPKTVSSLGWPKISRKDHKSFENSIIVSIKGGKRQTGRKLIQLSYEPLLNSKVIKFEFFWTEDTTIIPIS